jgi:hypothetical protein
MPDIIRQAQIRILKSEVGIDICFAGEPELFRIKKDVFFLMIS